MLVPNFIKKCPQCACDSIPSKEPLITTSLPECPCQVIAADLCTLQGSNYLVVVNYFSQYPEVIQLRSTTFTSVAVALKSIFAQHGIPDVLMSDNAPHFNSLELSVFAKLYNFTHTTSSPASNEQAERAVQMIKYLLRNADNLFLALLSYRVIPLPSCTRSPAELLMGSRIRTTLPQTSESPVPQWPYL